MVAGFTRRPDVVIVKNPFDRWPGRGIQDQQGAAHVDNLLRLVEVKYPGDSWGQNQARDYLDIAGGVDRLSALDVSDCNGDLERAVARARAAAPAPADDKEKERLRAPIRTVESIPQPAWYENWISNTSMEIAAMWDSARHGASRLSEQTQAWLRAHASWMFATGRWVADAAGSTWHYVDENGTTAFLYSAAELKSAWQALQDQSDLTWEQLKQIDWGHVAITALKGLATIVIVIAGVTLIVALAEAIATVVAALIAIVIAAVEAGAAVLAVVAAALGVTALATT